MRRDRFGKWLGMAVLLLGVAVPSAGPDDLETLIRQRQAELDDLRSQVESRRQRILQLRRQGEDLERILAELERQRSVTRQYIQTIDTQVNAIEHDLASRRGQLAQKEIELKARRGSLGQALVRYHKQGRVGAAELLFSSASFGEIFARSQYWIRVIMKLRDTVDEVARQRQEIRTEVVGIERRQRQLRELRQEREGQLTRLEEEETERKRDRDEVQRTVALYEEQTAKLLASQQQIEQMIQEAQRRAGEIAGQGLENLKGRLPWPVEGEVMTRFGTHIHPRYGTRVRQKGIEIASTAGTPVKSVAAGRVVFVGWLGGYGNTVVVDHGRGYFTLYAHASQTDVERGEAVAAGQTIARVGSTDSLKGPSLHFEIREGSVARDPQRWLR